MKLRIGFDVDEVVCKTIKDLLTAIKNIFNEDIAFSDIIYYDFGKMNFCEDPKKNSLIRRAVQDLIEKSEFFLNLEPYEDVVKLIKDLAAEGHSIYLITSRPEFLTEVTIKSLERYGLTYDSLVCGKEKGPYVKDFGLHIFVDDYHENLESIRKYYPECQLFLLDRPWNQGCNDFTRIFDCSEMLPYLNL